MTDFIDINILTGKAQEIARNIDNTYVKDEKLSDTEISVFLNECDKEGVVVEKEPWYKQCARVIARFRLNSKHDYSVAQNDATYVACTPYYEAKPVGNAKPSPIEARCNCEKERLKNIQYSEVFECVKDGAYSKKHGNKLSDKELHDITSMIMAMCEKYNILDLATVIAQMLSKETGGYVFSPKNMNNPGSQFKGVMQVNLEEICCIYGTNEPSKIPIGIVNGKERTISSKRSKSVYEYDYKAHYKQDESRISELKKKYPTPRDLYLAIQTDKELGLEVGIIVFKSKISRNKGVVRDAISSYCGNQYKCNISGCPQKVKISERA